MRYVKIFDNIAKQITRDGVAELGDGYQKTDDVNQADAILIRASDIRDLDFGPNVRCVSRSGAGYNNIPIERCTAEGIAVRAVDERPRGFSARFDAQWREYKYYLATGETPPVLTDRAAWWVGPGLDVAAMERGAAHLVGEHDFKSFCMAASAAGKPTCRNVGEISFAEEAVLGEPHLIVTVRGNAFLHSMVRTIVGTLVMVGRGQRDPDWVAEVLAARDRRAAGENAPARGLIFWSVAY